MIRAIAKRVVDKAGRTKNVVNVTVIYITVVSRLLCCACTFSIFNRPQFSNIISNSFHSWPAKDLKVE